VYRIKRSRAASRLSFFLWSSIPDTALLDLAAQNKLHTPAVLEQQVRRMLTDSKADALTTNFAGQWLYLRNLKEHPAQLGGVPDFDETCGRPSNAKRRSSSPASSTRTATSST